MFKIFHLFFVICVTRVFAAETFEDTDKFSKTACVVSKICKSITSLDWVRNDDMRDRLLEDVASWMGSLPQEDNEEWVNRLASATRTPSLLDSLQKLRAPFWSLEYPDRMKDMLFSHSAWRGMRVFLLQGLCLSHKFLKEDIANHVPSDLPDEREEALARECFKHNKQLGILKDCLLTGVKGAVPLQEAMQPIIFNRHWRKVR